jgi:ABC-2 type transport system permease protein
MKNNITYFIALTRFNIKNAYALTRSFWIGVVSMMLNNITFFVIWLLFMKATGPINGWTGLDVFGMLGVSLVSFGVMHSFFYGIVDLPQFVVRGTFDSVLLSPVNAFLKLSGSSFSVTAYGDLIQGIIVVIIYGIVSHFTMLLWIFFFCALIFGCITFIAIRLLCSLIVFFIHDGEVISRQVFEIFLRPGLYPGAIFPNKLKLIFLTLVPTLLTSALPIDVIKQHAFSLVILGALVTFAWVCIVYVAFKSSITRYESGNYLR